MAKTLIGVFDDETSAQKVISELQSEGVPQNHLHLLGNNATTGGAAHDDLPWTDKVANWFSSLVDDDDDRQHADHYAEACRRGHYVVVADVESHMVDRTVALMNHYGTVDVGRRAEEWKNTGYTGTFDRTAKPYTAEQRSREMATYSKDTRDTRDLTDRTAIPVVQEELAIGKRVVQRGGVRIHSYVQERPVEEVVRLREERIKVQRRPVNRPADASDMAFQERTVDVKAMSEEAVVEKRARVVEEVVVGKEVQQHNQTIKETVRRKDVTVEPIPTSSRTGNTTTQQAPISRH